MPLARVEMRSEYGLGAPELYRVAAAAGKDGTKEILDGVAAAGLVGILRQLGDVAEFAAEIFHDLHEQVITTSARGRKMLARIKKVEETLPSIEAAIHEKGSCIDLAYEAGSAWHADLRTLESPLSGSDFPRFMMDSYEECRDPPHLYLLDKYDSAGTGACLKRYSDPSYFKRAWATSKPEKAQQIQKEKKAQEIKRKYSRLRNGEVQHPVSTSQCNSLASSATFAPPSTVDQSFSAENSSTSKIRLKPEIICGSQILSVMKLNCTEQVSDTNLSVVLTDMEYDNFSVSNVQNNHDHPSASQLHREELEIVADDNSQIDLLHMKSTSQSSSIIWDEKSELLKAGLKLSGDTLFDRAQDSEPFLLNSESSKAKELVGNELLGQAKTFPIIADLPRSCGWNQLDDANEAESYMDALNTLESEAETDSECQTKQTQSLSNIENYKNESVVAEKPHDYSYSSINAHMELYGSSNKYMFPIDTSVDSPGTLELKRSTQEAGFSISSRNDGRQHFENSSVTMSISNSFRETNDDQSPSSNDPASATMLNSQTAAATSQFQISPPSNFLDTPYTKLWTNGNLLGLEPSKPPDKRLHSEDGEKGLSNISNYGVNLDKQYIPNVQTSKQLNSTCRVLGSREISSSVDQGVLNSKQLLSRKYVAGEHIPIDSQNDGFCAKQYSQERTEAILSNGGEGTLVASSNVLTTGVGLLHQTATNASCKEAEPCSAFNVASQLMDSVQNTKGLSPSFSRLAQRNLVQGLQRKARDTPTKSSIQGEPLNANDSQSQEKSLVDMHRNGVNGDESQTFYEHNLIGKTDHGLLEKSISSSSRYSENSSPPLEHMKISFHPMNGPEASSLKLEFPDGCVNKMIDGTVLPSFWLSPGCKLPSQDGGSESDDDTFCRSYPASTEDLLSPCSDSNSELWEQNGSSIDKRNEPSDDFRRSSSSTASVSRYRGFEQMNHVDQETGLEDIHNGNDTISFQPGYITNIPTFESFRYHAAKYDSLSISPENSLLLPPAELPPPPPLPPLQWRLLRPSLEISEDKDSNTALSVNHFEGPQSQNPPSPLKPKNIMLMQPPLVEVGQYKNMQDNYKLDSFVMLNLSSNPKELDRREQLLHQIRDMGIQQKLKPGEESKAQVGGNKGADEREDLLHQIRTKTFNLRRTATSRPDFVAQPTTNEKVAAILEKASAIRQACASSEDGDDDDDWSDG